MKIKNYLLENTPYVPSPNHNGKFNKWLPDTLIIHSTSGPSLESAKVNFLDDNRKSSAHIIIDRDGTTVQMVPFDMIAMHADRSKWGSRIGLDKYSIGIELVNAGALIKDEKGFSSWFGETYKGNEVIEAEHRNKGLAKYWHKFNTIQIKKCHEIAQLLIQEYGIAEILGHEEIDPNRQIDPGPAFPLDDMRNFLLPKPDYIDLLNSNLK